MNMPDNLTELLEPVIAITRDAGDAIMAIYQKDFSIYEKSDDSPLTEADLAAHKIIVQRLAEISDYPILSEESANIDWQERKDWQTYWLVDPLDGTKEFIKKNGEFTVNIALIHQGKAILGVVTAPAINQIYAGVLDGPCFKELEDKSRTELNPVSVDSAEQLKIVGSRSHQSPEIKGFLEALGKPSELVAMGSSLKLCMVAEGKAHLYPRLGPTSEWDTAAAHAVVNAAGGKVTVMTQNENGVWQDSGVELLYNQKESVLNPYFLVSA
ncbi:3'(2'),5'-bisphosphate nucleotidase CysQ [Planctobacterium marinum]|uniref:3'(2'),5'-bisphosphate nucleotidase CysQ n=2 Tax=Planctobacterium marinum TaxID=1631968 RepID=A0AA48HGX7_9ALTE|nr:3'(2'),5'-bisphosphate nucleotidase CysQ [Planctobacterium marinum]